MRRSAVFIGLILSIATPRHASAQIEHMRQAIFGMD